MQTCLEVYYQIISHVGNMTRNQKMSTFWPISKVYQISECKQIPSDPIHIYISDKITKEKAHCNSTSKVS